MAEEAERRVRSNSLEGRIAVHCLDAFELPTLRSLPAAGADAAVMGFGVINCVPEMEPLLRTIAACLRPEGVLILSSLSRRSVWDLAWQVAHGRWPKRWRRPPARVDSGNHHTYAWYRGAHDIARAARHCGFGVRWIIGVGSVAPPPYLDAWFDGKPRLRRTLCRVDERIGSCHAAWLSADMVWLALAKVSRQ